MRKVILLRFGELYLKGKNKGFFERTLLKNIRESLKDFELSVVKISGRYLVTDFDEMDYYAIVGKLTKVFGLTSLSIATELDTSKENIENFIKNFKTDAKTFRVSVKRADKTFDVVSCEYERYLGGLVLSANHHLKVKLKDAELELIVEIRENKKTYILTDSIECAGGMPFGTSGKGLLLLSGGIDSPVAGYVMAKRGLELVGLHFHSFPYTSVQAKEKVKNFNKLYNENETYKLPFYRNTGRNS